MTFDEDTKTYEINHEEIEHFFLDICKRMRHAVRFTVNSESAKDITFVEYVASSVEEIYNQGIGLFYFLGDNGDAYDPSSEVNTLYRILDGTKNQCDLIMRHLKDEDVESAKRELSITTCLHREWENA